ncbi:MAG TPA: type II secretion system ATPase GspE [Spirochaetota bacterium]|nr:type II secretion system ATPase GspE [Spirochaetota bacterium]
MAKTNSKYLGKILVDRKIITQEELQEAVLAQKGSTLRLGQFLLKKGMVSEEDILSCLAEQYDMTFMPRLDFSDPENLFASMPVHFMRKNRMVPFKKKGGTILVGIVDVLNIQPLDDLKMIFPQYDFEAVLTTEEEIQNVINAHFNVLKDESTNDVIEDLEESDFEILTSSISETEDIMDMANEAPIIRLVNTFIKQAVTDRASDIHVEPYEKDLVVRFRIDGILYNMYTPPKKYQGAIISRIKIMANLNIAENRLPQDGRIQLKIAGKDIDIRVSTFPTYYGERIVLRILNKSDMSFDLDAIGFDKETLEKFDKLIKKTYGIVLVTGPTGSGKSTTLYSVLQKLKHEDVNILTVEDPIEYQISGIGQMQVKPGINLTFASGLRSILRQDPDIIMVGEIRDLETAEIAVQAALTGHRVFSTLHTNDAASGITRLIDMGIEPFLITSSVNAYLAQRLARKICPACKEAFKPSPKMLSELGIKPSQLHGGKLYHGKGCPECLNTGYSGRLGIFELLPLTAGVRKMIMEHSEAPLIKEFAIKEGMKTLLQDGLNKAIEGITTVEEVLRVC